MSTTRTITATERMARSREATKRAFIREMLMAGILARLWPSYITACDPRYPNAEYPELLCIDTPAGKLVWRLGTDEAAAFEHLARRDREGEAATDRTPVLQALADGWE